MKLICMLLLLFSGALHAQERFVEEGAIEFERRINVHRQVEDADDTWMKQVLPTVPNFHATNFLLQFNMKESIYKPLSPPATLSLPYLIGPAKENVILTDFGKGLRTNYKNVFEQKFQISDSIGSFKWKITDEKRTIAGMECRKAVTIICDSVYVVAFYTDDIPVSGGPESFSGLPGMILGIAIPRLSTTWFATKVTLTPPQEKDFNVSIKAQKVDTRKLNSIVKSSLKDWGKFGERNTWWILL